MERAENKRYVIAVDGPSSTGKSFLAREVAKRIGFTYIDSGAMYRAASLFFLNLGIDIDDKDIERKVEDKIDLMDISIKYKDYEMQVFLNGEDVSSKIRENNISKIVSYYAKLACVRQKIVNMLRQMSKDINVILDGRDIGTYVFPNADVKIYVGASIDIRTQRRKKQLFELGEDIEYLVVKEELIQRDIIDTTREIAPLRKADDAVVIDTTNLDRDGSINAVINVICERTGIKID